MSTNAWGAGMQLRRATGLIAPLLLVLVATTQIWGVATSDLSRWKGGGFGMFSTTDAPSERRLELTVQTDAGPAVLPINDVLDLAPQGTSRTLRDALTLPSEARLAGVAELVAGLVAANTWTIDPPIGFDGAGAPVATSDSPDDADEPDDPDDADEPGTLRANPTADEPRVTPRSVQVRVLRPVVDRASATIAREVIATAEAALP